MLTNQARSATIAMLMFLAVAALQPASASCASARLFNIGYSYLYTPGCESVDCGSNNTSVTDDLVGLFWALGDGDEALLAGIDNGSFSCLGGWCYVYPNYPAGLASAWSINAGIDGCIDFASDTQRCMAILLMDNSPSAGAGAFALLTDEPDATLNYDFSQTGNITLEPLDALTIGVGTPSGGSVDVSVDGLSLTDIEEGLYLDPACPSAKAAGAVLGASGGVIQGYQVFAQQVSPGALPADNRADNWTPVGPVTPLGTPAVVSVAFTAATDTYVAAGLVFDSNFRTAWLSAPTLVDDNTIPPPVGPFSHSYTFNLANTGAGVNDGRLRFHIDKLAVPGEDYFIDDVSLVCGGGVEIVQNGDFSAGQTAWKFFTNAPAPKPTISFATGEAVISFGEDGTNTQMYQKDLVLPAAGTECTLTFEACSTGGPNNPGFGHNLGLKLQKHGSPYTNYGLSLSGRPSNPQVDLVSCDSAPPAPFCGDGVVDSPPKGALVAAEECDNGGGTPENPTTTESSTCDTDCTFAVCGDGTLNTTAGEHCDDGGTAAGDGCDPNCMIEDPICEMLVCELFEQLGATPVPVFCSTTKAAP